MKQYLDLIDRILKSGEPKADRTGTGTLSVFGHQMRFNLAEGFPLLTTKKLHTKSIIEELLWMLRGETNVNSLRAEGVTIWDEWADEEGELGPVYGAQWRSWPDAEGGYIDQIETLVANIKNHPDSRRHIVSAWNVTDLPTMALPPCHLLFQAYVSNGKLSLQVYQRSADVFLGVPFNIASYALLTMILAHETGLQPGELIWTGGDCHLYANHIEQAKVQLARDTRPLPKMMIVGGGGIDGYVREQFVLSGYEPHPHIPAPVAI